MFIEARSPVKTPPFAAGNNIASPTPPEQCSYEKENHQIIVKYDFLDNPFQLFVVLASRNLLFCRSLYLLLKKSTHVLGFF